MPIIISRKQVDTIVGNGCEKKYHISETTAIRKTIKGDAFSQKKSKLFIMANKKRSKLNNKKGAAKTKNGFPSPRTTPRKPKLEPRDSEKIKNTGPAGPEAKYTTAGPETSSAVPEASSVSIKIFIVANKDPRSKN